MIIPMEQEFAKTKAEFAKILKDWAEAGHPVPPPGLYKGLMLRHYAHQHKLRVFIETGTYKGNMVSALRNDFDIIHSIELDTTLYQAAHQRFQDLSHVHIHQGDSGKILGNLLREIQQPILFWLDAHYSAGPTAKGDLETPILKEMQTILDHPIKGHVILIDDARCFGVDPDYPALDELRDFVLSRNPDLHYEVVHDLIRIVPGKLSHPSTGEERC